MNKEEKEIVSIKVMNAIRNVIPDIPGYIFCFADKEEKFYISSYGLRFDRVSGVLRMCADHVDVSNPDITSIEK